MTNKLKKEIKEIEIEKLDYNNPEVKQAMKEILSGRINNPYLKKLKNIAKKYRKLTKQNKEIPKELEKEYKFWLNKASKWKL